jgi:hypothetical protein
MSDSWTYWQREAAGQSDHGVTTPRVLLLAVAAVLATLLWAGGHQVVQHQQGGADARPRCEQLRTLPPHGPTYWSLKPLCGSGHKTRP